MGIYTPGRPALGDVGSYQVSGQPFFRGSLSADNVVRVIEFPYVTNWIHIRNLSTDRTSDGPLISFSENGMDTNNYFQSLSSNVINEGAGNIFYLKVTKLYYKRPASATIPFDIVAGLTNIPTGSIINNWSGSLGVG